MKSSVNSLQKYIFILITLAVVLLVTIVFAFWRFNNALSRNGVYTRGSALTDDVSQMAHTLTQQVQHSMKNLSFDAIVNRESEVVFSVTASDLISNYNTLYFKDHGRDFLAPMEKWGTFPYSTSPHTSHETIRYFFRQNPDLHSEPTLSIYVPSNSDYVQGITLDFDDHGYTEWAYQRYSEECFYAMKTLFPDAGDEHIWAIFKELFKSAYTDVCFVSIEEGEEISPRILYHKNSVGIYPYYASGMVHICIIPVTPEYLDELVSGGCEIYELEI